MISLYPRLDHFQVSQKSSAGFFPFRYQTLPKNLNARYWCPAAKCWGPSLGRSQGHTSLQSPQGEATRTGLLGQEQRDGNLHWVSGLHLSASSLFPPGLLEERAQTVMETKTRVLLRHGNCFYESPTPSNHPPASDSSYLYL